MQGTEAFRAAEEAAWAPKLALQFPIRKPRHSTKLAIGSRRRRRDSGLTLPPSSNGWLRITEHGAILGKPPAWRCASSISGADAVAQSENSDDAAIGIFIAVFFGGLAAIIAAIVWGIMLYTDPYPGWVFFVPFMALAGVGYGTAYLLDHDPKRRVITALFSAVAGSAVFLVALYLIARHAPVLWNA